ncbi:MAG: hypothetical protein EP335_08795 [Alphaproteobacteria bacterium]|nr:MAG: hypothetical protein EP335_08795 [Alphaproteobacteria bacterium]
MRILISWARWRQFAFGVAIAGLTASCALACQGPNPEHNAPIAQLVERSPGIYLVRIERKLGAAESFPSLLDTPYAHLSITPPEQEAGRYAFVPFVGTILETLKGTTPLFSGKEVVLQGQLPTSARDFERDIAFFKESNWPPIHLPNSYSVLQSKEDFDFFNHTLQAFWEPGAGRTVQDPDCLIHPTFFDGSTYLIFTGPQHFKGYERIAVPDDRWLLQVREALKK